MTVDTGVLTASTLATAVQAMGTVILSVVSVCVRLATKVPGVSSVSTPSQCARRHVHAYNTHTHKHTCIFTYVYLSILHVYTMHVHILSPTGQWDLRLTWSSRMGSQEGPMNSFLKVIVFSLSRLAPK